MVVRHGADALRHDEFAYESGVWKVRYGHESIALVLFMVSETLCIEIGVYRTAFSSR